MKQTIITRYGKNRIMAFHDTLVSSIAQKISERTLCTDAQERDQKDLEISTMSNALSLAQQAFGIVYENIEQETSQQELFPEEAVPDTVQD